MSVDMLRTEEKIDSRLKELLDCQYQNKIPLNEFAMQDDNLGLTNPPIPDWNLSDLKHMKTKEVWTGRDRYIWLKIEVELPDEFRKDAERLIPIGYFDFGHTGGGYNSGFESMLYIDGEPYQSIDTNHKEVFFKNKHFGRKLSLVFRLWSGLEGGGKPRELEHRIGECFIGLLNHSVDDLYYLGDSILKTVRILHEEQPERTELLSVLDKAVTLIDWTEKGKKSFYDSVSAADDYLCNAISKIKKYSKVTVNCLGHTHIDTAWLWRLKHTREKVSRSFLTVLRLMELFPEYKFLHTQPQQYAFIKEDFPEIYSQIKEKISEGRWEADGAMWVEADCNIPSGESLTRQLLIGRKFLLEEFEKEPQYLWLPDVFGYSWALPQILKKSGIDMFVTTKLTWNKYNRMPNDTFIWKGMDGSSVLAHFLTIPLPGQDISNDFYSCYNGELYPDTVLGSWKMYREKDIIQETLISCGHGDGGGGTTREMLERRRRMDIIPGLPNVKVSTAADFFSRLKCACNNSNRPLATWDGEMYLEYHRGTYTSQAYVKKTNRQMENLYRKAEWITALNAINHNDLSMALQDDLTVGWKTVLTHQFHDIIPGSSIHEVYEDAHSNYKFAEDIANRVITNSLHVENKENCYSIINVAAQNRNSIVFIPNIISNIRLTDEEGKTIPIQRVDGGIIAYVESVPAMGVKYLIATKDISFSNNYRIEIDANSEDITVVTPFYEIILNQDGQISRLYDKENQREILECGKCGNVLQIFEDKPLDFDAWELDMFYYQKMQEIKKLIHREIVENGEIRTVIRQKFEINMSVIVQDIILYNFNRRIDFKTFVDWQETHKILKVAFPVDVRATYATYDIQYGNIRRPNNSNTTWERAKFECVGHRWADLSEHNYGVALLNDSKYGYDIHQNIMRLSLLKSATYPDYSADKGEQEFCYSLYPHQGDFVESNVVLEAFDLNQPLESYRGRVILPINELGNSIFIDGGNIEIDAFKKSEDGEAFVLRFHEYSGETSMLNIQLGFSVTNVVESDLMERAIENSKINFCGGRFSTRIKPYEIKTFLIRR